MFTRSIYAAQRILRWTGPHHRCWTSGLTGASDGGCVSPQTCWATSARLTSTQRVTGLPKRPAVLGLMRTEHLPGTQFGVCSFPGKNEHFHTSAVRLKKRPQLEPPPRELDLLRYDMKDLWNAPKPALCLGFAGLIPFVSPTMFMALAEIYSPDLAYAQLAYGAAIASFLGGARWGFALPETSPGKPDWINLGNSVVPSLFAWMAMLMSDTIVPATTFVLMALGISLHYDLSLLPTYPSWFKALRAVLTIVALFSLLGTMLMYQRYPQKNLF